MSFRLRNPPIHHGKSDLKANSRGMKKKATKINNNID
jgi:hypothetical protein